MSSGLDQSVHVPVLAREVLEGLQAERGGTFLDCTFGGGGHTRLILEAHPNAVVIACDRDRHAIERGAQLKQKYSNRLQLHHSRFSRISSEVANQKISGILVDLGISTDQLRGGRGFSFNDVTPLDMRMDDTSELSAYQIVNELGEHDLFKVLKEGGVGREARAVASAIVRAQPIQTGKQLGDLVSSVSRHFGGGGSHPATVVFQAIRMAVNDELDEIRILLSEVSKVASHGCRLVIISFHSLEDLEVTKTLRRWTAGDTTPALLAGPKRGIQSLGKLLTKRAIVPSDEEMESNPASRSARLRIFEFA